jgi:ABC-type Fe3+/spermidine/putrescine transport system ATPase subunit
MPLLKLQSISTTSSIGAIFLKDISIEVKPQQKLAIMGETGCGKTTLLKTIAGHIQHTSGTIHFKGQILKGPDWQLVPGYKGISYLSQSADLRHNYRMEELLEYANKYDQAYFNELINICNVAHLLKRNSKQLSGGEKQRISLVKLLLERPELILLDEAYSNLDAHHKATMHAIIEEIGIKNNCTFLISAHHKEDVLAWASDVIILKDGAIVQQGNSEKLYYKSINDYVAGLLGDYTLVTPSIRNFLNINTQLKYLRPQHLQIVDSLNKNAAVLSCKHFGGYYKCSVQLNDEEQSKICVNTLHPIAQATALCIQFQEINY